MGFWILLAVVAVYLLVRFASRKGPLSGGVPGRGILLVVAPTATRQLVGGQPYEVRQMTLDVEVPGKPPYEVSCSPLYPANLSGDMLPGATVELRVDPKNPQSIAIVGPGVGFAAAGLLTTPPPPPAASAR